MTRGSNVPSTVHRKPISRLMDTCTRRQGSIKQMEDQKLSLRGGDPFLGNREEMRIVKEKKKRNN